MRIDMRSRPERRADGDAAPGVKIRQTDDPLDALKQRRLVQLIDRSLLDPAAVGGDDFDARFAHDRTTPNERTRHTGREGMRAAQTPQNEVRRPRSPSQGVPMTFVPEQDGNE